MTGDRLDRLKTYIKKYQDMCEVCTYLLSDFMCILYILQSIIQLVSKAYGKDFKFPKQHWVSHVIEEIEMKGAMTHCSARPGEGFFQEVRQAYDQTNKRNEDIQVFYIVFV